MPAPERSPTPRRCWGRGLGSEFNARKVMVTHLSAAAFEPFDRPRYMIYLDGKSDGFGELLPDMIERDLGPSFMTGSA